MGKARSLNLVYTNRAATELDAILSYLDLAAGRFNAIVTTNSA
jgi:hypothetical protein